MWTAPSPQGRMAMPHRSGASMCPACLRSTEWLLALMKSADRIPDHVNALDRRRAPLGLSDPRSDRFVITQHALALAHDEIAGQALHARCAA